MFYAVLCPAVSIYAHTITTNCIAFGLTLSTTFKIDVISIMHRAQRHMMSTLNISGSYYTEYVLGSTSMISKNNFPPPPVPYFHMKGTILSCIHKADIGYEMQLSL